MGGPGGSLGGPGGTLGGPGVTLGGPEGVWTLVWGVWTPRWTLPVHGKAPSGVSLAVLGGPGGVRGSLWGVRGSLWGVRTPSLVKFSPKTQNLTKTGFWQGVPPRIWSVLSKLALFDVLGTFLASLASLTKFVKSCRIAQSDYAKVVQPFVTCPNVVSQASTTFLTMHRCVINFFVDTKKFLGHIVVA